MWSNSFGLFVISSESEVTDEVNTVCALFEEGLDRFHLRKPGWSVEELISWLEQVPSGWLSQISIPYNCSSAIKAKVGGIHFKSDQPVRPVGKLCSSKSFHDFESIQGESDSLDYCFLSPVFDSISKPGYQSGFDNKMIGEGLSLYRDRRVVALGGVCSDNITGLKNLGFAGAAVMGAIWQKTDLKTRLVEFKKLRAST